MVNYTDNTDVADEPGRSRWMDNYLNAQRATNPEQVGTANRMAQNADQGVGPDATPQTKSLVTARVGENAREDEIHDWRVSLSVPKQIAEASVLQPLTEAGKLIFPFNPTILLGHSASYAAVQPTHTNHPFYAYENSIIDNITITGEFVQESERDAKYWVAALHYLRTMTKMFYGNSVPLGNPPLIARLNGYGPHVLNNIPVVITNFTTDMPQDVDYIECEVNGEINYVPMQGIFTVTCQPQYARRSHARFSLNEYANGQHIGSPEGWV